MEDREQNLALDENRRGNRTALIAALVIMLVIVGVVAAVVFFNPDSTSSEDSLPPVSADQPSDDGQSNVSLPEQSDDTPSVDAPSTPDISDPDPSRDDDQSQGGGESSADQPSQPNESKPEIPDEPYTGWIINSMGYTFVYENMGLQQFNGTSSQAARYAEAVEKLAASLAGKANVYSMLVPTHVEFVRDSIPNSVKQSCDFYCSSQSNFISKVTENIKSATSVNIYDALSVNTDKYLYFNTDTNWTSLAAYYAYAEFIKSIGGTPVSLDQCKTGTVDSYLGQFFSAVSSDQSADAIRASDQLYANKDYVDYYKIPDYDSVSVTLHNNGLTYKSYALVGNSVGTSNAYNTFLGRAGEHFEITTGNTNGKKLVVVGDGSVPPMLQFLANDYQTIHYLRINAEAYDNYYSGKLAEFIAQYGADDVLIATYCTNAATPTAAASISGLLG